MSEVLRVVAVSPAADLTECLGALGDGYQAHSVATYDAALAEMARAPVPVVILDLRDADRHMPPIPMDRAPVVTIVDDDPAGLATLQAGATDFLTVADLDADCLLRTIRFAYRHAQTAADHREELREEYRTRLEDAVDAIRASILRKLGDRYEGPIHGIRKHLHALQAMSDSGVTSSHLDEIAQEVARLESLARQATVASDALAVGGAGYAARFDLAKLLDTILELYQRPMARAGARIEYALAPAKMHGDAQAISDAVEAFIRAAARASGINNVLRVQMEVQAAEVTVEVISDALGWTPEHVRAAMDPTEEGALDPAGMSLFLARRLIHAAGGTIEVHPAAETGCRVALVIPRARVINGMEAVQVLHVEDDPDDRVILQSVVRRMGLPVHIEGVPSLVEARQRLSEGGIDIVFLDLHLPDADLDETMDAIVNWSRWVPVVAVTGADDKGLSDRALGAGSRDFIRKENLSQRAVLASLMRSALLNRSIMRAVHLG